MKLRFRPLILRLVIGLALFVPGLSARASRVVSVNLEVLAVRAERIVEATCLANRVEINPGTGLTQTVTTFEISDTLKGEPAAVFELRQYGGINSDGAGLDVPGLPRYEVGERSILFLAGESAIGLSAPIGLVQGKFTLTPKPEGKGLLARNGLGNQSLFRGVDSRVLLRRDARGEVIAEDRPILRALQSGPDGMDSEDFKSAVRRLIETSRLQSSGRPDRPGPPIVREGSR